MFEPQQHLSSPSVGVSLGRLLADIARAVDQGHLKAALRLADSARRYAPANPTCLLLHAKLLIRLGVGSEAAERLRGHSEPEAVLARAEALYLQQLCSEADACFETLLRRYAVNSVEGLLTFARRLCRAKKESAGWVGVDTSLRLVGEVRTGSRLSIACSEKTYEPATNVVDRGGFDAFAFQVPAGFSGRIKVFAGNQELLGSEIAWPPEFGFSGWVVAENQQLTGRVKLEWAPTLPVTLDIRGWGNRNLEVPVAPGESLFSVSLDSPAAGASVVAVSAISPDGSRWSLPGSPLQIGAISPTPVGTRPKRAALALPEQASHSEVVDIVVPVYSGLDESLLCLNRVLTTTTRGEAELVVVNDASSDSELCAALSRLAAEGSATLLTNPSNIGFPASANRGIRLHPNRDVVLLNSDTVVFGDWLHRLRSAAYREDDIGTVTPLGEFASIMSYPSKAKRRYSAQQAAEIDDIARTVNAGKLTELPVGVGYCLYIRRSCLDEVGSLDEVTFDKGYGEENDFCLRARRLGWRHVGATDLFVGHHGGLSYGPRREALMERNRRVLNALHPGYEATIAGFVAEDPLRNARRAIDRYRLLKSAKNAVLLVTCEFPGGVERHLNVRQTQLSAGGHTTLMLQPAETPNRVGQTILTASGLELENLVYNLPDENPILAALLAELSLSHVELHHFAGLPSAALELVTGLRVDYDVYVHDYCWICPRLNLIGGNGVYCGEPAVEQCEDCIRKHGTALEESLTVKALRTRSAGILQGARRIIVPSEDVKTRLCKYFPGLGIEVTGWEAPSVPVPRLPVAPGERVRVAVIGAIGIHKGHQVLLECARDAADRSLNLDFVVIGYTSDDDALMGTGRVFVSGPYEENEIDALLDREQCDVALFPSVVPETWCYALTHAIRWGLPIIAFDLGAIGERLRTYAAADLLPLSTTAADINDSLLRVVRKTTISDKRRDPEMSDASAVIESAALQELEASAKLLTLPVGFYAFTVQGGASPSYGQDLAVPALQVGIAPKRPVGTVEFLAGAATLDRWLMRNTDTVLVRISGAEASLLLTSVRRPNSPALAIDVRKLEGEPQLITSDDQAQPQAVSPQGVLPSRILAHIRNFGDAVFGAGWAGFVGGQLAIEAFAILLVGQLSPDAIEYCGVTADGIETPWVGNQILCGTRARGLPMTAFAIRLKPGAREHYRCEYSGRFVSGSTKGPLQEGALCSSEVPADPLEGIELRVMRRAANEPSVTGQAPQ
jgi:GT2 family glycosyltransferase